MQGRRIAALHVHVIVVHQLIQLVGGDAGFHEIADIIQRFGNELAQLAHFFNFFGGVDDYCHDGLSVYIVVPHNLILRWLALLYYLYYLRLAALYSFKLNSL